MGNVFRVERENADWMSLSGEVLFVYAVFNPNGPTLNCIGLIDTATPACKEVFFRSLHFLVDESAILGNLDLGSASYAEDLAQLLRVAATDGAVSQALGTELISCIPSFMIGPTRQEFEGAMKEMIKTAPASEKGDWGREIYLLRKYDAMLFDRAGEELREGVEDVRRQTDLDEDAKNAFIAFSMAQWAKVQTFTDWAPNRYTSGGITDAAFDEWYDHVRSAEFIPMAVPQLLEAWVGATYTSRGRVPVKVTVEDVRDFLARFRMPLIPASWSTTSIARSMGIKP